MKKEQINREGGKETNQGKEEEEGGNDEMR